jgi:hypothetical protein
MGAIAAKDNFEFSDHSKFGPNTTARFEDVILFRSDLSITLDRNWNKYFITA